MGRLALLLQVVLALCPAVAAAQAARIMLDVARPSETLSAPLMLGPVSAPPGVSPGSAAVGTLLALAIVRGVEHGKERAALEFSAGLKQALTGVDLRRQLAEELRREAVRTGYPQGVVLEAVADVSDMEQPGLLLRVEERDIFTLDVRCVFDKNMTSLHLFSTVRLWRKNEFKPLYTARLHYVSKRFGDEQEARRRWIADDGALLRNSLREGVAETARMFFAEAALRGGGALPPDAVPASWIAAETGQPASSTIHVLAAGEDRVLGRTRAPAEATLSIPREAAAAF